MSDIHVSATTQGSNAATVLQHGELRVAAARLLAAQGMVRQGYMVAAIQNGPVTGWPSPSASSEDSSGPSAVPSGSSKRVSPEQHSNVVGFATCIRQRYAETCVSTCLQHGVLAIRMYMLPHIARREQLVAASESIHACAAPSAVDCVSALQLWHVIQTAS